MKQKRSLYGTYVELSKFLCLTHTFQDALLCRRTMVRAFSEDFSLIAALKRVKMVRKNRETKENLAIVYHYFLTKFYWSFFIDGDLV